MRLTKSRFALALSCPTKLFYASNKSYANQALEDTFLASLAEGGFQVGELAKHYFRGGFEIKSLDEKNALRETAQLLERENVIIFEAAIQFENCLIRVDVLEKIGKQINLHEVKAKSFDGREGSRQFLKKDGLPKSIWEKYLYDIAFQKWVVNKCFVDHRVSAHLMLADKSKRASVSGLNQKFRIKTVNNRKSAFLDGEISEEHLREPILTSVNVDEICTRLISEFDHGLNNTQGFEQFVSMLSDACRNDEKFFSEVGVKCGECEFHCTIADQNNKLIDGRAECFRDHLGMDASVFNEPTVFDLWNYRNKDALINDGRVRMRDISLDDINIKTANSPGLTISERQWLQVEKTIKEDDTPYVDNQGLQAEMSSWVYPLHFIDFETTMVAIPFTAGRAPYEGIAFQFSHHMLQEDGSVRHAGEYLCARPGVFPNYDFLRNLRKELSADDGTIFMYSSHENTFINLIIEQLQTDLQPPEDRDELIDFAKSISTSKTSVSDGWIGRRAMVDLLEIVKKYYYDPQTNGSNSIKQVLPAILNRSQFLQNKYSQPIYGAENGIHSWNFVNKSWLEHDDGGKIIDPYQQLPELFLGADIDVAELLSEETKLKNGGAALMAYARMQFEVMTDYERSELENALLKYCELDTLAMVMLVEGLFDACHQVRGN